MLHKQEVKTEIVFLAGCLSCSERKIVHPFEIDVLTVLEKS